MSLEHIKISHIFLLIIQIWSHKNLISVCLTGYKKLADRSCSENQKSGIYDLTEGNVAISSDDMIYVQVHHDKNHSIPKKKDLVLLTFNITSTNITHSPVSF